MTRPSRRPQALLHPRALPRRRALRRRGAIRPPHRARTTHRGRGQLATRPLHYSHVPHVASLGAASCRIDQNSRDDIIEVKCRRVVQIGPAIVSKRRRQMPDLLEEPCTLRDGCFGQRARRLYALTLWMRLRYRLQPLVKSHHLGRIITDYPVRSRLLLKQPRSLSSRRLDQLDAPERSDRRRYIRATGSIDLV